MDKDQEDADKLQKALLKKEEKLFNWEFFAFSAILLTLIVGVSFVIETIAKLIGFYD
jgi:hypothetical protein